LECQDLGYHGIYIQGHGVLHVAFFVVMSRVMK